MPLAAEKLAERHAILVSRETRRTWTISARLWVERKARGRTIHQPRYRRDCIGELVQIDGCEHGWFEDRGPQATLLVFVDDATSRLMQLKFVPSESAFAYLPPRASTSRRTASRSPSTATGTASSGSINRRAPWRRHDPVRPGPARARHRHHVRQQPQAKGRVERANRTLQDRLVKELRLAGIKEVAAANELLPAFLEDYNRRFAKVPRNPKDLHRPLAAHESLDNALAWREERTVSASLTLQSNKVLFLLEPNEITRAAARQRVVVHDDPDGRPVIRQNGVGCPIACSIGCARSIRPRSSPTSVSAPPSRMPSSGRSSAAERATSRRAAPARQRGSWRHDPAPARGPLRCARAPPPARLEPR